MIFQLIIISDQWPLVIKVGKIQISFGLNVNSEFRLRTFSPIFKNILLILETFQEYLCVISMEIRLLQKCGLMKILKFEELLCIEFLQEYFALSNFNMITEPFEMLHEHKIQLKLPKLLTILFSEPF